MGDKAILLEDGRMAAELGAASGAIVSLVSRKTGWRVQGRGELGRSWRMMVPLEGKRNHQLDAAGQDPPKVAVESGGRRVHMVWESVKTPLAGTLPITVEQTIALEEGGLRFDCRVTNRSRLVVENVSSPCLGDLAAPSADEPLSLMHPSYSGMLRRGLLPKFDGDQGYFGFDWPWMMASTPEAAFVLAGSERQGLYVGCHDTTAREPVRYAFYLKPGFETSASWAAGWASPTGLIDGRPNHLEMEVWHFPYAKEGESIELAPIVVSPYVGDWTAGVDLYKEWRRTWFRPPPAPAWARDVHSWQQVHINSPEDELRCRYTDLVKYGEDCARHGVAAIQLVGWNDGGQDRGNPSHDTDPRLGTREELAAAIERIQALGVKMILFSKFTWADRSQEWFRKEGVRYASKDPYGDYHVYGGYRYQTPTLLADPNTRRLVPMCHNCADWREVAGRELAKLLDLGAAGTLHDEGQHHGGSIYCFDPSHGHRVPAHMYAGDAPLAEGFHRLIAERGGDFLMAGEACYDLQYRHYSVAYTRIANPEHVPVQRYMDPRAGIMIAVTGFNDRNTLNQCLLYRYIASYEPFNFKGRLDDFPRTIEYGKRMDALRRKLREFLWDGEFRHTQGAAVSAAAPGEAAKPYPWYSVFRHADGSRQAVVIANFSADKELAASVELASAGRELAVATPESPGAIPLKGKVILPPGAAGVVMER